MLSFKKDQVDAGATAAANAPQPDPEVAPATAQTIEVRSLASLAAELRRQRTGRARVYTIADLTRAPEVSLTGASTPAAEPALAAYPEAPNEKHWRSEARTFRRELESAQDHAATAEAACGKASRRNQTAIQSFHRHPAEMSSLMEQPSECRRMEEMKERLKEARDRFDDFQERARRAGVPWQWLE